MCGLEKKFKKPSKPVESITELTVKTTHKNGGLKEAREITIVYFFPLDFKDN